MSVMHMERSDVTAGEKRLLEVLRERGPQTLDELCALPDFDWAQVLMAVDRLSRTGDVVLELVGPCEYHVSLGRGNS